MPISVACPTCASQLSAPDDSAGRKLRCPKCGTVLVVPALGEGGGASAPPAPPVLEAKIAPPPSAAVQSNPPLAAAAPHAAPAEPQFYFIENGERFGPLSLKQMRERVARHQIRAENLVWREGMAQWVPAREIPELFAKAADRVISPAAPALVSSASAHPQTPGIKPVTETKKRESNRAPDMARVHELVAQGMEALKTERHSQAIELLHEACQENPEDSECRRFLAGAYLTSWHQGWTYIPEGHPLLKSDYYATKHEHVSRAQQCIDKARELNVDDPDITKMVQEASELVDSNLCRRFVGNWAYPLFLSFLGGCPFMCCCLLPPLITPAGPGHEDERTNLIVVSVCAITFWILLTISYLVSSFTPQYRINEQLVQGKDFNQFAFLGRVFGQKPGVLGAFMMHTVAIILMPFLVAVNFYRNWISA